MKRHLAYPTLVSHDGVRDDFFPDFRGVGGAPFTTKRGAA
jgi:hypothetical protein